MDVSYREEHVGRKNRMNEDPTTGQGEHGTFEEGQAGVQWARESEMRWGERESNGWTISQLDTALYFRSTEEPQKALKGVP